MVDAGLLEPVRAGTAVEAITGDAAHLRALLDVEAALARAQARIGLIPAAAATAIEAGTRTGFDLLDLARRARGAGNPVVPLVQDLTAAVRAIDPAAAEHVHRGATSQDIVDSAAMLVAARALDATLPDLARTAAALADLAERHRATVMAGRTLTQHAVPTTFGLKAAEWCVAVTDAHVRVRAVRAALPAQLGGAAGTLAAFGPHGIALLAPFAAELGLAEPVVPWHTLRGPILDLGGALAHLTGALGKFAGDVALLGQTEVGEVDEPAGEGRGGSSAMPHKRNPVLSVLIVSAARQVPAYASILAASMAGAEHERPAGAWHAEWQPLRACLRLAGGSAATAAELAEGLVVHPERMRANLDLTLGRIVSERLSAELAGELGRTEAKRLLAEASRTSARTGRHLRDVLGELDEAVFDPAAYIGSAPALIDRALAHHRTVFQEKDQ
ncbi:3-carboxy-cis,cis-muconate cycloisomerase [Embleya sp. NBC_00896]|uniref:3-carboxy-cis,cis-muconate cycloisomerase n=1 Tax=Embleya sp. NBC_00896 TaxID=2975961 RepID=UPI00386CF7CA|nr:3-carboxy-cis,cis-muconate cycloisomerase [Embleya sp. NBC_00896]